MLSCLCFSKDRPLQLEGYIKSLEKYASEPVRLSVLFKCGDAKFEEAYLQLAAAFPMVEFIPENDFKEQLHKWLDSTAGEFVMFGCDDVVFKEYFDLSLAYKAFSENPTLFGFSLRLGLESNYAVTQRCWQARPLFSKKEPYLLWNWIEAPGPGDWRYPFELDCTIYRKALVETLVSLMDNPEICRAANISQSSGDWGHPNKFELFGDRIAKLLKKFPFQASYRSSKGIVITVNRVQSVSENHFFDSNSELSPEHLLEYWNNGIRMDVDAYKDKKFRSVHVSGLCLCRQDSKAEKIITEPYDPYKIMVKDFVYSLEKARNPLLQSQAFSKFLVDFYIYITSSDMEKDQPICFMPCLRDMTQTTPIDKTYFYQDSWCFSRVLASRPKKLVDVGSTALLVGIMSYLQPTESIDIRPLPIELPGLTQRKGSITELPYPDKSIEFLTSMCVIEHIGLGRYGDMLDPRGSEKAMIEIARVIAPKGRFVGSVPISREPYLSFNANRVFSRDYVFSFFPDFELVAEQYLYPDPGPAEKIESLLDYQSCVWCFELIKK